MGTRVIAWLAVTLLAGCAPKVQGELPRMVDAFEANTRVDLHIWGDRENETPPKKGPRYHYGPPTEALVLAHLPTVEGVLLQYPEPFRTRVLTDLWVVGKLVIGDTPFLGVARPATNRLDIAFRRGTTEDKLQRTMHHEIAHLMQGKGNFDRKAWKAVSAESYAGMKPELAWKGKGRSYLRAGFVSKYASKNIHEDFAEMAELAWTRPDRMRVLFDRFPRIRVKMLQLTAHYQRLAPGIVVPWYGEGWRAWVAETRAAGRRIEKGAFQIDERAPEG